MNKFLITCLSIMSAVMLTACEIKQDSREIESKKQEEMSLRAVQSVGMPAISNYAEKRMMKDILEKRDRMSPTYTYVMTVNGKFVKICDSLGYGLPYATQYTNPQMVEWNGHGMTTLPQADPNGLYSPASADGTWVMCLDPKTKKAEPQYVEQRIFTMTFPLE
jgi:hypothetical protein